MFGIPIDFEREIAQVNVTHSWAIYYITGYEDSRKLERDLYQWIKKVADDITVAKVLKEVLFLFLENKAVKEFNSLHKEHLFGDALPYLPSPREASHYGLDCLSFPHDPDIIDACNDLMEKMMRNELTPFGKVEIAAAEYARPDMNNPFFPVGMRPLFWSNAELFEFPPYVPTKFLGVVDLETGYTFTTASDRYCLYTNKEVYDLLLEIADRVFSRYYSERILTSHILLNKRGVYKAIAKSALFEYQPFIIDGWQPIIEAVNSYDKTENLRYTFGFINKRFSLPLLMLDYSISVNTAHIIPFEKFREKALRRMNWDVELNTIVKAFSKTMETLQKTALSDRDMLPLFCKYFNIREVPESDNEKNSLMEILRPVDDSIKYYSRESGKNAFSMLHVIMEYISRKRETVYYRSETQLGKWVSDFIKEASVPGFSISKYIGHEAYDVISWYSLQ